MRISTLLDALFERRPAPTEDLSPALLVEANGRGGWSISWEYSQSPLGNYPTAADACRIAELNHSKVRISEAAAAALQKPFLRNPCAD